MNLTILECLSLLPVLPPHRMTIRERGEHDGYHGISRAALPKAALQIDYDRGYAYGQGCRARLEEVRLSVGRQIAIADAAPSAFKTQHPQGRPGVHATRWVS